MSPERASRNIGLSDLDIIEDKDNGRATKLVDKTSSPYTRKVLTWWWTGTQNVNQSKTTFLHNFCSIKYPPFSHELLQTTKGRLATRLTRFCCTWLDHVISRHSDLDNLIIIRAGRIKLFTPRVLCRASYGVFEYLAGCASHSPAAVTQVKVTDYCAKSSLSTDARQLK